MQGRSLTGMLRSEAKRRPEIQDLVDRVLLLTEDDIESAVVPLPWFRIALRKLQTKEKIKLMTNDQSFITSGVVPDIMGRICSTHQIHGFVQVSSRSSLYVETNFPLFFPESGGVWVDTVFVPVIPPTMKHLPCGEIVGRTIYKQMLNERRKKLF